MKQWDHHVRCRYSCADPGIFVRRVQARRPENSLVFYFLFFNPELILQFTEGVQWFYDIKNLYFPKDPEGVQYFFQGGGGLQFFPGGFKCIFYSNPYNMWFSSERVSGPPIHHLDPYMLLIAHLGTCKKRIISLPLHSFGIDRGLVQKLGI